MVAAGALNFPSGELFVALQMLLAVRAGEFELAHASFRLGCAAMMRQSFSYCNRREFSRFWNAVCQTALRFF
jgi:hypothetical protein